MQRLFLYQNTPDIHHGQQLLEGCALAGITSVVSLLGQGKYKCMCVNSGLDDKVKVAISGLERGTAQGLAVADQLVQTLCPTRNPADNPGLQHLVVARCFCEAVLLRVSLVVVNDFREAVQVEKSAVRRPALVIQTQRLVKHFPVLTGKALQIT